MHRSVAFFAFSAMWMAFAAGACVLNPQPLPPDQPDGSAFVGGGTDAKAPSPDAGLHEAGSVLNADGGAGESTAPTPGTDAGEGGSEAGDAATDAPSDGGDDGSK
jgi:hypothetical protein